MTDNEKQVVHRLAEAWNAFLLLPVEHADDVAEFRAGIHRLQEKVLARAGRREMNSSSGEGWTDAGREWLAAGCPPIKQEPSS